MSRPVCYFACAVHSVLSLKLLSEEQQPYTAVQIQPRNEEHDENIDEADQSANNENNNDSETQILISSSRFVYPQWVQHLLADFGESGEDLFPYQPPVRTPRTKHFLNLFF